MSAPSTSYRRVLRYFVRYRMALVLGVLCVLGSRGLMVLAPRVLGEALNLLSVGGEGALGGAVQRGWWFVGVTAAAGGMTFGMRVLLVGTSRRVERDLKRDLFSHVERLPTRFFDRTRTGDLLARLTSDVDAVRFSLGPGLMYVGGTVVLFPLALASMIQVSPSLAFLALIPLLLIMLVVRLLAPGIMRRTRAVQERIGDLSARAQESFAGARVVRAYATEPIEEHAFEATNRALVEETLELARYRAWMTGALYGLGGMASLIVLWHGGALVIDGTLHHGDLVTFLAYVGLLMWPMISVGWVVSSFQRSAAAMQRLAEILDTPTEAATRGEPTPIEGRVRGALRVHDLSFTYPEGEHPALQHVDVDIPAGTTLGLVGPVGSGKSTLLSLLTRRYDPPPGAVLLDGQDVRTIPLDQLRAAFSVVPQDAFLFSTSLEANLAYATRDGLEPARAQEVLDTAGLADEVAHFPDGLATVVGERGMTLSGGQKQRTTLARALLRDAQILLIDDALSAVDTETEARILEGLRREMRRRTSIVVAHRLSTVRHADRIVVLRDGQMIESGTHEALLERGGWYADTYEQQRLQAELESFE